eukprot:472020-Prorocentrum_minimum.AAC.1
MGAPACIAPLLCGKCLQAKYADKDCIYLRAYEPKGSRTFARIFSNSRVGALARVCANGVR